MIAALIFVVSIAALGQFFLSYCRSVIATSRRLTLSEQVREVTGIDNGVQGEEFARLLQLVQLCPEPGDDGMEIRAVRTYFRLLNFLRAIARPLAPAVASWAEHEREGCAYFAAVTLDHRIAYNRDLMSQQTLNRF